MRKEDPLQQKGESQQGHTDITAPVICNSLGGLYGRYAIAHIAEILCKLTHKADQACNYYLLPLGRMLTNPPACVLFDCMSSSGKPGFTYIPIPPVAEMAVATVMGKTGSDM